MKHQVEKNIPKVFAFRFFWMGIVIIPVIVPFFQSHGLNMHEIFLLQVIFSLSIVLFEVPSGYLSDLWGRKNTLVIGSAITGMTYTYLGFANGFWELVGFEIVHGIGLSLVSGADLAILYDSSQSKGDKYMGSRLIGKLQMFGSTSEALASILGGLLAAWSFQHMLVGQAIVGWIPFFIALSLVEPTFEKMSTESHWANTKEILWHIFRKDRLLKYVFINWIVWSASTFFAVWMVQKHWKESGVDLTVFGFIWASYMVAVGMVGTQVHRLERRFGSNALIVAIAALPILGYFGMALNSNWVGVVIGVSFSISRGINQVLLKDAINSRTPSRFRATTNSLMGLMFRLSFSIGGPAVGFSMDKYGTSLTMFWLGCVFLVGGVVLLVPLLSEVRKQERSETPEKTETELKVAEA